MVTKQGSVGVAEAPAAAAARKGFIPTHLASRTGRCAYACTSAGTDANLFLLLWGGYLLLLFPVIPGHLVSKAVF